MNIPVEYPADWDDYQLLDSGGGEKFESVAGYKIIRPDPRAIWKKGQPQSFWNSADALFARNFSDGRWNFRKPPPNPWKLRYQDFVFNLRPTDFRHIGVFPEQAVNWNWLKKTTNNQPLKILNLFAYTGGATIAAAKAGAKVTHVDSSRAVISWAKENCLSSGLPSDAVRWIEDDALKFVQREQKRNSTYDGIILDPPRFGHGVKGEIWKLEEDLHKLLSSCREILSSTPKFILVNAYTADLSAIALGQLVESVFSSLGGNVEFFELALKENNSDRLLPNGISVRWSKKD